MVGAQRVALDSNAAILLIKGHWLTAELLAGYEVIVLPAPVVGELLFGVRNALRAEASLQRERSFIAAFPVMPVTGEVAEQYAEIRFELKKNGRPIPENDMWIAAVCRANDLPLVTTDQHFKYVAGLHIIAA